MRVSRIHSNQFAIPRPGLLHRLDDIFRLRPRHASVVLRVPHDALPKTNPGIRRAARERSARQHSRLLRFKRGDDVRDVRSCAHAHYSSEWMIHRLDVVASRRALFNVKIRVAPRH